MPAQCAHQLPFSTTSHKSLPETRRNYRQIRVQRVALLNTRTLVALSVSGAPERINAMVSGAAVDVD